MGSLAIASGLAGCAEPPDAVREAASRRDSAGVEIVESPDRDEPWATIDTVPRLSLGGIDADGPTRFSRIDNIHVQPDGDIWVSDRRSRRIEVFAEDGTHRFGLGGHGEGPSEFQVLRLLGGDSSGRVFAMDARTGKFLTYSPEGSVLHEAVMERIGLPEIVGVTPDGGLIGWVPPSIDPQALAPGEIVGDSITYLLWSATDAEPTPVHTPPSSPLVYNELGGGEMPFTTPPGVAVADLVYFTAGVRPEVRGFQGSTMRRILRVLRPAHPVSDDDRAAYRRAMVDRIGPENAEGPILVLEHPGVPRFLPAYDGVLVDDEERVWAARWTLEEGVDRVWDVFDESGVYVGYVTLPAEFTPHAVRERSVVGVWTDDLDVESVRRFAIGPAS